MAKNCKHRCECEHNSVKYCKRCYTVHCEDCNQEWQARSNYGWLASYTQPSTYLSSGTHIAEGSSIGVTGTVTLPEFCKHEGR